MLDKLSLIVKNQDTFIKGKIASEVYDGLRKVLGYRPEDAYFKMQYNKYWDGIESTLHRNRASCRCEIKKDGTHFPTGLYSKAAEFLRSKNVSFEVFDERLIPEKTKSYSMSESFEERDYQTDAVNKCIERERGVVKIATGGGKTSIASSLIAKLNVAPFIFYVPSIDLLIQTRKEIKKFLRDNGSPFEVGAIGGGLFDIRDITVMTIQTAVKACGQEYIKYDDEEEYDEEDKAGENILIEKRKDIVELIRRSKGFIADETQHWAAESCQIIADYSIDARYRYGFSVGPDSFVELKGYPFGEGFHGSIESAWDLLFEIEESFIDQGYEIINVEKYNIQSRGWNGKEFCWKKINNFIRHVGPDQLFSLRYRGKQTLQLTGDHSVFRVEQDDSYETIHNVKKFYGKITEVETEKLNVGDILLQDNGNKWGGKSECIDVLYYLSNFYSSPDKIRIRCDLSKISHEQLNLSKQKFNQISFRNPNGSSVNIHQYLGMLNSIKECPTVDFIYTEGAKGIGIHRFIPIEDLSYLLGFYIGDGWFDNNRVNFAVEKSRVDNFLKRINSLKWLVCNPVVIEMQGESVEVRINNTLLVCVLKQLVKIAKCYDKRLSPEWIVSWSKENRRKLLEGLIDSDGYRIIKKLNKTEVRYVTTSFGLSQDVMSLVRSLGGRPSLSVRKASNGGVINGRQINGKRISYQVIWAMSCLDDVNHGHYGSPKKFLYKDKESLHEVKVREIKKVPFSGYVYDFEMEGHPSFVANGILVHNSATPWRDKGDDILIDACFGRLIVEYDASFLIKKKHLVKPDIFFVPVKDGMPKSRLPTYASYYKSGIVENEVRNKYIANSANMFLEQNRNILILCRHISHGKILEEMINNSFFIYGKHSSKEREEHLDKMRKHEPMVTIATSIFDEGVDCKPLDTLILAGSGKCIVGDSNVFSDKGLLRINEVIKDVFKLDKNNLKEDNFYDINNTMKLSTMSSELTPNSLYFGGMKKCYNVVLDNGLNIEGTENHRLRILRSGKVIYSKIKNIKDNDRVLVKKNSFIFGNEDKIDSNIEIIGRKKINIPSKLTPEISKFIAYCITEGSLTGSNREIRIENVYSGDSVEFERFGEIFNIFPNKIYRKQGGPGGEKTGWYYSFCSIDLMNFIKSIGVDCVTSDFKTVPKIIRTSSRENFVSFMRGVFDAESNVDSSGIDICMSSKSFINDIQLMLLNLGINSYFSTRTIENKEYYRLQIRNINNLKRYNEIIGFSSEKKSKRLLSLLCKKYNPNKNVIPGIKNICRQIRSKSNVKKDKTQHKKNGAFNCKLAKSSKQEFTHQSLNNFIKEYEHVKDRRIKYLKYLCNDCFEYVLIKKIEYSGEKDVFDFSIPGVNYIANGVVSHNSQTRALQRVGRILRPYENKETGYVKTSATVIDFEDHAEYLLQHSKKRRKIYETESEFNIQTLKM